MCSKVDRKKVDKEKERNRSTERTKEKDGLLEKSNMKMDKVQRRRKKI